MYDDLWSIEEARLAIEQGHRLYTVDAATGAQAEVELHGEGIRTILDPRSDNALEDLPPCG
jgi:hypothetical protein